MKREYFQGQPLKERREDPLIPGMRNQDGKLEQIVRLIADGWSFKAISILTRSGQDTVRKAAGYLKAKGFKVTKAGRRKRADGRKVIAWGPWWHLEKSA